MVDAETSGDLGVTDTGEITVDEVSADFTASDAIAVLWSFIDQDESLILQEL